MRIATYTLRIERPADYGTALGAEDLGRAIQHAEDVVNDRLPEGFYCKIDQSGEGVNLAAVRALEAIGDA